MSDDPIAHLDFAFTEPVVVDVTLLDNYRLTVLMNETCELLHELDEMYSPADQRSAKGKELHSIYLACQIERQRRNT